MIDSRYSFWFDCIDSNDDKVRAGETFIVDTDSVHYANKAFADYCKRNGYTHVRETYSECDWNPDQYGKFVYEVE